MQHKEIKEYLQEIQAIAGSPALAPEEKRTLLPILVLETGVNANTQELVSGIFETYRTCGIQRFDGAERWFSIRLEHQDMLTPAHIPRKLARFITESAGLRNQFWGGGALDFRGAGPITEDALAETIPFIRAMEQQVCFVFLLHFQTQSASKLLSSLLTHGLHARVVQESPATADSAARLIEATLNSRGIRMTSEADSVLQSFLETAYNQPGSRVSISTEAIADAIFYQWVVRALTPTLSADDLMQCMNASFYADGRLLRSRQTNIGFGR